MMEDKPLVFRFADMEVRENEFLLIKQGAGVAVEPKAFRVLVMLLRNPQKLITKEELLDTVWKDAAVTENSIARCITVLRRLIGDDARSPQYIETVATVGYRFICSVEASLANSEPAQGPLGPGQTYVSSKNAHSSVNQTHDVFSPTRKRLWAAVAAVVLIVGMAGAWFLHPHLHPSNPIHSLAVLPLENLSGNQDQEYFADGMTDELITQLARLPDLRVVSRTSVMQERNRKKTLQQIARDLDVDAIVEGTVLRFGDRVRITAQLIDVRTDKHLWAQSFEKKMNDVLGLQDEVAREIAAATSAALLPQRPRAESTDPVAYDAYLRGLYFLNVREGSRSADYFEQVIRMVPQYAPAYAGLAQALVQSVASQKAAPDSLARALTAAQRAIELDPFRGEAYTARGWIEVTTRDWPAAGRDLEKGLSLGPNDAIAETEYSIYLVMMNRIDEAVAHMRHALKLDPLSFFANRQMGSVLYYARRYDESLLYLNRAVEMNPDRWNAVIWWSANDYEMKKNLEEAMRLDLQTLNTSYPADGLAQLRLAHDRKDWKAYQSERIKLLLGTAHDNCAPFELGESYLRLGDLDHAFLYLNRAADRVVGWCWEIDSMQADPLLDSLRNDPQYPALLKRMKM